MTPVYINARFLTQAHTGVQRFATQLSIELARLRPNVRFLTPKAPRIAGDLDNCDIVQVGRTTGHLWEQCELPLYLRKVGHPLLLNFGGTAPALYRNQISTQHDIAYIRYPSSFTVWFRVLYRTLIPRVIRHSRALITVSEFSQREISSQFGLDASRYTVVPNAVDARFSSSGLLSLSGAGGAPYFLAVSSLASYKNVGRLIDAFLLLSPAYPDLELRVIGSQAPAFVGQNYYTGENPRVRFLGRVDDRQLIDLYRGAVAFVFPSIYEGFGIPPLEAQQCGCPVVASKIASLTDTLGRAALFVDPLDVDAIAAGMTRVLQDSELRTHLAAAGPANAARFSWTRSAEIVSSLIDRVLDSHRAGSVEGVND